MTGHPSEQLSPQGAAQEWRVLRFNEVTRQSVALVGPGGVGIPDCLGFPYLKTIVAAGKI